MNCLWFASLLQLLDLKFCMVVIVVYLTLGLEESRIHDYAVKLLIRWEDINFNSCFCFCFCFLFFFSCFGLRVLMGIQLAPLQFPSLFTLALLGIWIKMHFPTILGKIYDNLICEIWANLPGQKKRKKKFEQFAVVWTLYICVMSSISYLSGSSLRIVLTFRFSGSFWKPAMVGQLVSCLL